MQLSKDLWIEGPYYVDYDHQGQFRVVGPQNHLHYGAVGLGRECIQVTAVETVGGQVEVHGLFAARRLFLHDPAMGHIRKVRDAIEYKGTHNETFAAVAKRLPLELAPNYVGVETHKDASTIVYKRTYGYRWYGVRLRLGAGVQIKRDNHRHGFWLKTNQAAINFVLFPQADKAPPSGPRRIIAKDMTVDFSVLGSDATMVERLWRRAEHEIEHMVRYRKTSGVYYGTVFPRDWMESADLGSQDMTRLARRYMYQQAMLHVDRQGAGWHEDIIGEFRYEERRKLAKLTDTFEDLVEKHDKARNRMRALVNHAKSMQVNRGMIDIEPRYILGLPLLKGKLSIQDLSRLRRVARYLLRQADRHHLIVFKKVPFLFRRHVGERYYQVGNWRDSDAAFKQVHPIVAPFDVNVVFYPQALRLISTHAELLDVDQAKAKELIKKWDRVKDWYRFTNADGLTAFALGLYDVQEDAGGVAYKKLEVNHTDEAYELFYGQPLEADVVSLCQRLCSSDYFCTESGPTIVGARDGYGTWEYHGRVIWTKQTAYIVAGLQRLLETQTNWHPDSRQLMTETIVNVSKASIRAWSILQSIPELHYDKAGQPHQYSDQAKAVTRPGKVQLWSSVGARRIIRTYLSTIGKN